NLELHLRDVMHDVFGAAIDLGLPLLPPEAAHFAYRQSLHAEAAERLPYGIEPVRLNDCNDVFHDARPRSLAVTSHLPLHIVGALAVNPRVESLLLGLGADAQADDGLDHLGDGEAYHERPEQGCDDAGELDARLDARAPAFRISDAA